MNAQLGRLLATAQDTATPILIVRIVLGVVFFFTGASKFLVPQNYGAGMFSNIGIPAPEVVAPLVGTLEMVCGVLMMLGLGTRLAAAYFIVVMLVALSTSKVPLLFSQGFVPAVYAARLDFAMLLTAMFVLIVGPGPRALDAGLADRRGEADAAERTDSPAVRRATRI